MGKEIVKSGKSFALCCFNKMDHKNTHWICAAFPFAGNTASVIGLGIALPKHSAVTPSVWFCEQNLPYHHSITNIVSFRLFCLFC